MAAPTTERPIVDEDLPPIDLTGLLSGFEEGPDREVESEEEPPVEIAWRPLIAAGLATIAAGLVAGGIFGSWAARGLGLLASVFGVFWAWLTLRARGRETTYQVLLLPASLALGLVLMIPSGGSPSDLPALLRDAVDAGRLFRPPVPFDPGWYLIMTVVFTMLGFAAAWVATALDRPRLAIAVPLPVLGLTAITQPDTGEFIAGLCAFVPLIGALAVLFGGDSMKASELTREFELKRAVRGLAGMVAAVVALVVLSNASFLFPKPSYDPSDKPQKPKPIPLSAIQDRVLFEVKTDSLVTGPWKTGVLDVYDGTSWRLPPYNKKRYVDVPADGVVDPVMAPKADQQIQFTIRGLGNAASLPGVTAPAKIDRGGDLNVVFDPRANVFRMPDGRVPADVTYTMSMPNYPDVNALSQAPPPEGDFKEALAIPPPPAAVQRLLDEAPVTPTWTRLDYLRKKLRDVAVAAGGGVPGDITPERVGKIFTDPKHEASPYEIVAAEAMLARWAGVPSRIGFGFDGFNDEDGVRTIRPRNAAQWLEVYFQGYGWVPLIQAPDKAKQTLDKDENQQFDPNTVASDEVAVELYVPIKLESLRLLYERLRQKLVEALPYVLVLLALYLATPAALKQWRRRKRRRWGERLGARAQIAVEYAEFRDLAHDLNVGDPLDTPLEYLKRVIDDVEHQEFAWLVSRAMYGDLAQTVTDEDAHAAEELGASLRRRMFRAQPFQARALSVLGRASIRDPYTTEVPNVVLLDPLGRLSRWRRVRRAERLARRRRGRRRLGWRNVVVLSRRVPALIGRRS